MITIEELSDAYYRAASAFEAAKVGGEVTLADAIELQDAYETMLETFKSENPEASLFIDVINKAVSLR